MLKNGVTPLYIATFKGHEQIVQILLEKGNPNVELATKVIVILLFLISAHISKTNKNYLFIFSFLFPFFFFMFPRNMGKLHLMLLLLKDIIKLFNFY